MARTALHDLDLSDGACRLIQLLLESTDAEPFPLSHKMAGKLVGLIDKKTLYARIKKLSPRYLNRIEIKGCPPTVWFSFNWGENTTVKNETIQAPADTRKKISPKNHKAKAR